MKDINFFESYIEKKEFKLDTRLILIVGGVLVSLILIFKMSYNGFAIIKQKKAINSIKEITEDVDTNKKLEDIRDKEVEMEEMITSMANIRKLDEDILRRDIINDKLLRYITLSMPEELFLTSFGIYDQNIQLSGISKDKWSIAEFARGLEILEDYKEIFISNISLQDDFYNFEIHIDLGGEEKIGEETVEEVPSEEDEGSETD